jgi:UDP-N-acetylglucosamine 2-epimerase
VGATAEHLVENALRFLALNKEVKSKPQIIDFSFGDGHSSQKIVEDLIAKVFNKLD